MKFQLIAILVVVGLAVGCATVPTSPDITEVQVKKMLDAARFSGAEQKSPYEYLSANLYFEQALTEKNNGNWTLSRKYLALSYDKARLAYDNARKFRKAQ